MNPLLVFLIAALDDSVGDIRIDLFETAVTTIAGNISVIATGIGSVMMMLLMFYYITSILDGGKFHVKMLVPILIFVFVCNSSWLSKPVVYFITTITDSLTENLRASQDQINKEIGKDIFGDRTYYVLQKLTGTEIYQKAGEAGEGASGDDGAEKNVVTSSSSLSREDYEHSTRDGLLSAFDSLKIDIVKNIAPPVAGKKSQESQNIFASAVNYGAAYFGSLLLSWIVDVIKSVIELFGNAMIAIILALTPVVFAFAMFPGHGKFIRTWFIRLCQFSLYGPLCVLVNLFSSILFANICNSEAGFGFLVAVVGNVVDLCLLFCIPTLASLIIEGASGAASLSQGLQSAGTLAGVVSGGATLAATTLLGQKRVEAIKDTIGGVTSRGIGGMVSDYTSGGISGLQQGLQNAGEYVRTQGRQGGFGDLKSGGASSAPSTEGSEDVNS